jgi:hypothetical protein
MSIRLFYASVLQLDEDSVNEVNISPLYVVGSLLKQLFRLIDLSKLPYLLAY